MTAAIDRLAPAARPSGKPAGFQTWRDLAFLHWRVSPEAVRRTLPDGLEVDTFGGAAWVGLVPFLMTGVRTAGLGAVPGVSTFRETNVRTYVTRRNADGVREPGVYFYSLDASKLPAVLAARSVWKLPYYWAAMTLRRDGDRVRYTSRRRWPGPRAAASDLTVTATGPAAPAAPGTLEHFLAERYLLFTPARGRILRGQVHHTPYPLRAARVEELRDGLTTAAGFNFAGRPPDHVCFSDGVDVTIHPLA